MELLQVTILLLLSHLSSSENHTGTTSNEILQTVLTSAVPSSTTVKGDELNVTTNGVKKNESTIMNTTVTNLPLLNTVPTSQSPQNKTENQSSIGTTEKTVSTLQPNASTSEASVSSSIPTTIPENTLQSQGTENGKNASASATSPSYSSIILPVVIALIVITLSMFGLVGLYRMCWKTDPGTQENGNDQPQSDKESVKLLTVKTISHESGERSAPGKNKN